MASNPDASLPHKPLRPVDPRGDSGEIISLGVRILLLRVGPGEKMYAVHEQLLCKDSPFFVSASKQEWNKGINNIITLPDDDSEIFDMYTQWLYLRKIISPPAETGTLRLEGGMLLKAYIFGEKIQDGPFRDAVMDALASWSRLGEDFPSLCDTEHAYKSTPNGSPLRKWLLDQHVYYKPTEAYALSIQQATSFDFCRDLLVEFLKSKAEPSTDKMQNPDLASCLYHQHPAGELCRFATL